MAEKRRDVMERREDPFVAEQRAHRVEQRRQAQQYGDRIARHGEARACATGACVRVWWVQL